MRTVTMASPGSGPGRLDIWINRLKVAPVIPNGLTNAIQRQWLPVMIPTLRTPRSISVGRSLVSPMLTRYAA
jgi:hypothetical protein